MAWVVMALIVLTFAAFCTAHVATAWTLGARGPWWRGLVSFVVLPLAPYWAVRERLRGLAGLWVASLLAYAVSRLVAGIVAGR